MSATCTKRPRLGSSNGVAGSGKSTLIAGMTVAKLMDPDGHYKIAEGAAPIEFLFDRVRSASSSIIQSEIPRDVASFPAFVRGAMRREATDIVIGECRETETMEAAIEAASGCNVTAAMFGNGLAMTVRRLVALCPIEKRGHLLPRLAMSLRLIVSQRLVRSTDGRRTALREFVVFDRSLRNDLLCSDPARWPELTLAVLDTHGQSLSSAAERALRRRAHFGADRRRRTG